MVAEPQRPPLRPDPPSNQNLTVDRQAEADDDFVERPRRRSLGRTLARILVLPLYIAVGALSIGIIALFVKDLLGL
jgi:hypothetical protein